MLLVVFLQPYIAAFSMRPHHLSVVVHPWIAILKRHHHHRCPPSLVPLHKHFQRIGILSSGRCPPKPPVVLTGTCPSRFLVQRVLSSRFKRQQWIPFPVRRRQTMFFVVRTMEMRRALCSGPVTTTTTAVGSSINAVVILL